MDVPLCLPAALCDERMSSPCSLKPENEVVCRRVEIENVEELTLVLEAERAENRRFPADAWPTDRANQLRTFGPERRQTCSLSYLKMVAREDSNFQPDRYERLDPVVAL